MFFVAGSYKITAVPQLIWKVYLMLMPSLSPELVCVLVSYGNALVLCWLWAWQTVKNEKLIQIVVMETRFSSGQLLSLQGLVKIFDTMKLERRFVKHKGRRGPGWSQPSGRKKTTLPQSSWFPSSPDSINGTSLQRLSASPGLKELQASSIPLSGPSTLGAQQHPLALR